MLKKRLNILTGEWRLISPHQSKRPWQEKVESIAADNGPEHVANCYLCPGNKRSDGTVNPAYNGTYVFTIDFSALLNDTPERKNHKGNLLKAESESGICRVRQHFASGMI
ncbi:galactose-1-phosphate uridylyltransferase [Ferruginibacter sp.]|uniref:galactose-1-phosphate uridylyltransferase n=1 Tax=Ferruginibacter sp. TaxID=1940288 RepID=UPI00349EFFE3